MREPAGATRDRHPFGHALVTLDNETFKGGDPKGAPRVKDKGASKRARQQQRSCVLCGDPAAGVHHVVPKGSPNFGDDLPANLVALCTGCHGDVEGRKGTARKELGAYLVRCRPDVIEYARKKLDPGGDAWLQRHYKIGAK